MSREPSKEEIENIGKIIQRNLATRTVGFDDPNCLAMAIRDEEGIRVNDKSAQFGFKSFKELLESPMMDKFVKIEVGIKEGRLRTTYTAKMDATTRKVMEQQKWFHQTAEGRLKEQRRQNYQSQSNAIVAAATAKRRCSMAPLSVNHPSLFQTQSTKATEKGNTCKSTASNPNKWKLDFLTTKTGENDNKSAIVPQKHLSECRKSVAPTPAALSFSPSSPTKKRTPEDQVFFHKGWKLLELHDKECVKRRDGICEKNPEYNVDHLEDPRHARRRPIPLENFEWLIIPEFFANFSIENVPLSKVNEEEKLTGDEDKENEDDGGNCELINLRTTDDDSSDDDGVVPCSKSAVAAARSADCENLTEEKMHHLGAIATSFCKYKYKFRCSTPVKFDLLHKVLSDCEPLFDAKLMKDSQRLVDFFTLFCPKLELVYPPTKHPIDKFHLYYNSTNE
ncbi:hypothetical protein niasHT_016884 [Heterodera trifolii]|uniref:DUF7515 domain-containing protein n=1 Tax=Heterodera trifolii TaxID=157864 RepID=A0ABD2KU25_9BILA